ncbi:transposase [Neolewinella aurantiaca]|uniref:transposase n=1 Tax=Neolewinella aurantiaca TaxID=2602767 RepID=UPI00164FADF9|nr:transposase [Neolewinella aurantiaca]
MQKLSITGAWRTRFLLHLFGLWPALLGRHNFVNLGRQGDFIEYTYRKHFDKPFDWLAFNLILVKEQASDELIIGVDPSYIPKAGKHTAGVGRFHSGKAGRRKPGIEITGLAAIDMTDKTAYHLEAVQTIDREEGESELAYYARIIEERAEELLKVSKYIVADAFFSRNPFMGRVVAAGFHVITRARKDISLRYYHQPKPGVRKRKWDGKVDLAQLDTAVFSRVDDLETPERCVWQGVVNQKSVKLEVKAVIIQELDNEGQIKEIRTYLSTDTSLTAAEIMRKYAYRFQQEFLFRDGKQFVGLEQGQGRSKEKIHFHTNMALTTVNLAKIAHYLDQPASHRVAFSMSDITTAYRNERLALHIFRKCGIDPHTPKMQAVIKELKVFGARTA